MRRIAGSGEEDAFTRWRHVLCYMQRAGTRKKIKRRANRRERKQGKEQVRREFADRDTAA